MAAYLIAGVQNHDIIGCQIHLREFSGHLLCLNIEMSIFVKWRYDLHSNKQVRDMHQHKVSNQHPLVHLRKNSSYSLSACRSCSNSQTALEA